MSDGTRIVLADPEGYILEEIANPAMKRLDVARTYRLILASGDLNRVNWRIVNTAITERWSLSALQWIKRFAWKNSDAEIVINVNITPGGTPPEANQDCSDQPGESCSDAACPVHGDGDDPGWANSDDIIKDAASLADWDIIAEGGGDE